MSIGTTSLVCCIVSLHTTAHNARINCTVLQLSFSPAGKGGYSIDGWGTPAGLGLGVDVGDCQLWHRSRALICVMRQLYRAEPAREIVAMQSSRTWQRSVRIFTPSYSSYFACFSCFSCCGTRLGSAVQYSTLLSHYSAPEAVLRWLLSNSSRVRVAGCNLIQQLSHCRLGDRRSKSPWAQMRRMAGPPLWPFRLSASQSGLATGVRVGIIAGSSSNSRVAFFMLPRAGSVWLCGVVVGGGDAGAIPNTARLTTGLLRCDSASSTSPHPQRFRGSACYARRHPH